MTFRTSSFSSLILHCWADLLKIDAEQIKPEAYFITDLNVDSLRLLDMMLGLEKRGFRVALESVWQIQTVGEAYAYCQQQLKK